MLSWEGDATVYFACSDFNGVFADAKRNIAFNLIVKKAEIKSFGFVLLILLKI